MNTHILSYTLRHPDYRDENCPNAIVDVWTVGTESEIREAYAEILKHENLYCAAVSRIEVSTDW